MGKRKCFDSEESAGKVIKVRKESRLSEIRSKDFVDYENAFCVSGKFQSSSKSDCPFQNEIDPKENEKIKKLSTDKSAKDLDEKGKRVLTKPPGGLFTKCYKDPIIEPTKEGESALESVDHFEDVEADRWQTKNVSYLADKEKIEIPIAKNIIKLLDEGNTIPFIARYRRDQVGQLEPNKLRKIKTAYEYIQKVNIKAKDLIKKNSCNETLTSDYVRSIQRACSLEELDYLTEKKGTLAQQAKALSLDQPAHIILKGTPVINLNDYVKHGIPGLENITKIKEGIQYIIAEIFSKTPEVYFLLLKIVNAGRVFLHSKKRASKTESNSSEISKYDTYENFSQMVMYIKPHQTLAIFRGETEKKLTIKIVIPAEEWVELKAYCQKKWIDSKHNYELRQSLIMSSINDAIKRLFVPFVQRQVRSKLKREAEEEAIKTFGSNLKQLLLTPPCKGKIIMGIDPGFRFGCKVAVISKQGVPLEFAKVFLPLKNKEDVSAFEKFKSKLKDLILKYECDTIALGNGKGCRETEVWLIELIKKNVFKPINVCYNIISEQGISIYSCSPEAAEEFPDLDTFYIGAISLARRLQDPLSELVKVEPKHLGIGLYQHDMKSTHLNSELEDIVSECVSFVGVDVNTASVYLLRRVAGLNILKAKEIVKYREKSFGFRSLEELKNVKGIGTKTFVQCAGFLRIIPSTSGWESNYLDQTPIHPESYELAEAIAYALKVDIKKIGSEEFITGVQLQLKNTNLSVLANKMKASLSEITFIIETFCKPVDSDIRGVFNGPVFNKNILSIEDLKVGQKLTGVVTNVVPFGAFVDVGIEINGLIHRSKMKNTKLLLNDRVSVKVLNLPRNKIELMLERKL